MYKQCDKLAKVPTGVKLGGFSWNLENQLYRLRFEVLNWWDFMVSPTASKQPFDTHKMHSGNSGAALLPTYTVVHTNKLNSPTIPVSGG